MQNKIEMFYHVQECVEIISPIMSE
jgi:hypothetical protein